jgi:maleylacetoacetate isomerase
MELYSYFRSSASYRVRIALALKRIDWTYVPIHLLKKEHLSPEFAAMSPAKLVPLLRDGDLVLSQSLAIIEYLDETWPHPPLLPSTPAERAQVRAVALDIACEIHPLDNLRVLRYLVHDLGVGEEAKDRWYRHWVETGLESVEQRLRSTAGDFCHGDTPTMADCVLVPQVFNARRMQCRLDHVPTAMRVFDACMQLEAFSSTQPSRCPDAT